MRFAEHRSECPSPAGRAPPTQRSAQLLLRGSTRVKEGKEFIPALEHPAALAASPGLIDLAFFFLPLRSPEPCLVIRDKRGRSKHDPVLLARNHELVALGEIQRIADVLRNRDRAARAQSRRDDMGPTTGSSVHAENHTSQII